ncbi:MAG: tripartite tricarboxylate transporter TctB family protein [Rhodobacterales bacterium]|jgi:hypothetical protein|tara:strand:- start:1947 stop:2453 length:507 start_codon:yes stop_codon:yes gene_type:complete
MKNIKSGNLLFAILFTIISAFLISQFPDQIKWFKKTKLTSQPALWSAIGLIGMTFFSLIHLLLNFRTSNFKTELKEGIIWIRSVEFAGWFLLYVILVPNIGYLFATILVAPALTYRVGYHDKVMIACSIITGLFIVLIFKTFLEVKIPGGAIYEFLPNTLRSFMILNF